MYPYLPIALLGSALFAFAPRALAHEPATTVVSLEYQSASEPTQSKDRRAHAGVVSSSLGILFSTVGIVVGAAFVRVPDIRHTGGDTYQDVRGAEKKRTAGGFLLVLSPAALGTSIFGLVRSRRTRDEVKLFSGQLEGALKDF